LVFKAVNLLNPVQTVKDGVEVISYLDGKNGFDNRQKYSYPGVLFLDLNMPKVSGFEVLSYVGSHSVHRGLRVVVLTGLGDLRQIREAYRLGASFITKPVTIEDFQNLTRSMNGVDVVKAPDENGCYLQSMPQLIGGIYGSGRSSSQR
jgi:two-component system, response regulator